MATTRREFLRNSTLASASLLLPNFLKATAKNLLPVSFDGKVLVIIQLSGGNDGLNTVVPFTNDTYYKLRPDIGLDEPDIISITDVVALNSSLSGLADLYHNGNLAIVNNVGYPNPNRSHFRSTDIWQSASDENKILQSGWIGRYLDSTCNGSCALPHHAIELDDTLSLALRGDKLKGLAFRDPSVLQLSVRNEQLKQVAKSYHEDHDHPQVEYLHKILADTYQSAEYIYDKSKIYKSKQEYPQHEFAKRMKSIAELICSGCETKVYYVSLSGFDTHVFQKGAHSKVLKTYGDTLKAFCDDLKTNNRFNDTVVMTFSEFGRRVSQNASKGTDHGTANNVFITGGKLNKAGLYNPMPDLQKLEDGDLTHSIDFQQVYATLIENWMKADSVKILNDTFTKLDFI